MDVTDQRAVGAQWMEQLVEKYGTAMLRIGCVYLKDEHLAQDAVQDAFIKIYRHWRPMETAEAEKAWVLRVTINVCKDYLRSAWKRRVSVVDRYPEIAAPQEHRTEEGRLLAEVMDLKPKYKEVILLHFYQNMRVKEISEMLNIPQSTVSIRLRRAKDTLKKRLEGGPYEDL